MRDLRLAIRALRTSPIVSGVAGLSLALGIGANTAIFSIVNALLLRPLPVPHPERLVTVSSGYALSHGFKAGAGMNYQMWSRMNERIRMFDGGFAWAPARVDLSERGEMQPADALFASGAFFTTLAVPALIGRTFTAADDVGGGGRDGLVTVLGYGLWQRRFNGSPQAVGATLTVDGVPLTVIGVMPKEFFGVEVGQPFDVAIPLAIEPALRAKRPSLHDPRAFMLTVMLRLGAGQRLDTATTELRSLQGYILGNVPEHLKEPYVLVPAATGTSDRSALRRRYARPLLTILAIVGVVLLVACVNIANLLLARAAARRHEMSVRIALGASRWRIARQLLVESLVLSGAGAAAGVVLAVWASRGVVAGLSTADNPVTLDVSLDWRVLLATAAISVAAALLFGLAPAFQAGRVRPAEALGEQGRGGSGRANVSSALVVAQVAFSLVLVAGAGLLVSTFSRLASVPLGFDRDRILVVDVDTARAHADQATRVEYFGRLVEALSAVPGVASAAASSLTPFNRGTRSPLFMKPGRVHEHAITPAYFATYGMTMRAGRTFYERDTAQAPRVVIVSESYARKFFPDGQVLGAAIDSSFGCGQAGTARCTVVGVVSDAVFGSARDGVRPTVYAPMAQTGLTGPSGRTMVSISVRSAQNSPALLASSVARTLEATDADLAFSYRLLHQDVDDGLAQERLLARLSGFFAGLAVLLAAAGLYGIAAYAVARRRVEIGIRIALGATRGAVIRVMLGRIAILLFAGVALGVGVSAWAGKFLAAMLYDVQPHDAMTLAAAAGTLATVGLIAAWLPSFRGSRIDPAEILRQT